MLRRPSPRPPPEGRGRIFLSPRLGETERGRTRVPSDSVTHGPKRHARRLTPRTATNATPAGSANTEPAGQNPSPEPQHRVSLNTAFPGRSMVGQGPLKPLILVRIQTREPRRSGKAPNTVNKKAAATAAAFLTSHLKPELTLLEALQLHAQARIGSHRPRSIHNPVPRLLFNQRRTFVGPLVVRVHFERSPGHKYIARRRVDR